MGQPVKTDIGMPWEIPAFRRNVARQMEECKQRLAERIAENIQRERLKHGQNPGDVAYRIGVNPRTYERWEEATTIPQPHNFKALAEEWEVEITDLRPDLEAEQRQLDHIEHMLEALLDHFGLSDPAQAIEGDDPAEDQQPSSTAATALDSRRKSRRAPKRPR